MRLILPSHAPRPLRLGAFALAAAVLLYLCLAPSDGLPEERLWDKAEHGLAWAVLTAVGLLLSPRRPLAIAAFALVFGAAVEALQAALPFGRHGDVRDLVADSLGVGAALLGWRAVRALARRR